MGSDAMAGNIVWGPALILFTSVAVNAQSASSLERQPTISVGHPATVIGSLLFSREDYPASALRSHEQGTSTLVFTISPSGRVINCVASGATPTLNFKACMVAEHRWLFNPATDADGKPVASTRTQRVVWQIPSP